MTTDVSQNLFIVNAIDEITALVRRQHPTVVVDKQPDEFGNTCADGSPKFDWRFKLPGSFEYAEVSGNGNAPFYARGSLSNHGADLNQVPQAAGFIAAYLVLLRETHSNTAVHRKRMAEALAILTSGYEIVQIRGSDENNDVVVWCEKDNRAFGLSGIYVEDVQLKTYELPDSLRETKTFSNLKLAILAGERWLARRHLDDGKR